MEASMEVKAQEKKVKRTYIKPQVTEIRLVAGEAVLANCKDAQGGLSTCKGKGDLACYNVGQRS
jgi:hypothetical protein